MIPMIYLLILVGWGGVYMGFKFKDPYLTIIFAFFLMCLGVYIIPNGLDNVKNWLTESYGIINICVGGYISIRASYEIYKKF